MAQRLSINLAKKLTKSGFPKRRSSFVLQEVRKIVDGVDDPNYLAYACTQKNGHKYFRHYFSEEGSVILHGRVIGVCPTIEDIISALGDNLSAIARFENIWSIRIFHGEYIEFAAEKRLVSALAEAWIILKKLKDKHGQA